MKKIFWNLKFFYKIKKNQTKKIFKNINFNKLFFKVLKNF